MGGLPGAKFTLMRTIGMILNLVVVILSIVFTGVAISTLGDNMILILIPIVAAIAFAILIKVEIDFVDDHRPVLLLATVVVAFGLQILFALVVSAVSVLSLFTFYVPLLGAEFAMVICWHYTLTIYLNEKKRYFAGFLGFEVLFVGFGYSVLGIMALIAGLLVAISVVMVFYSEKVLLSKKLLTYIK